jgi:hypothetical protein
MIEAGGEVTDPLEGNAGIHRFVSLRCPTDRRSAAPNSADRQRWGTAPSARTIPRIDWNELPGGSCNFLLGAGLGGLRSHLEHAYPELLPNLS